jgi:hypothetical protein
MAAVGRQRTMLKSCLQSAQRRFRTFGYRWVNALKRTNPVLPYASDSEPRHYGMLNIAVAQCFATHHPS